MKRKRHSELRRQFDRALDAAHKREWWDGRRWRPDAEHPRTKAEANAYRTPHEVMEETNRAMIGDGPADGVERLRAARRFARSAEANLDHGKHTEKEADAYVIYEAVKPLLRLHPRRTPWKKLAMDLQDQLHERLFNSEISPTRLRMICLRAK